MADGVDALVDEVVTARAIRTVFQPIVAMASGEVVAVEALTRGPEGSPLESASVLFDAARGAGRVAELDWAARAAAFEAFAAADLPPSISLCVNVEPESLGVACPPDLVEAVSRAESLLRVFVEVGDEALAADPAGLVVAVDRARSSGWGVALGGVGGNRASLAALPVLGADLVKVDMGLLRQRGVAEASAITLSVLRHVEVGGAALLVQGIEDADDAAWARALGATYGQGYHYGRPGPLPASVPVPRSPIPLMRMLVTEQTPESVFDVVSDLGARTMAPEQLEQVAQVVYGAALVPGAAPVVLASRGLAGPVPDEVPDGYPELPTPALLAVLFGTDVEPEPYPGVRGVRVHPGDPIAHESFLVILGERDVVGVLAAPSQDDPRLVDVVVTQDPVRVHHLARALLHRVQRDTGGAEPVDEAWDGGADPVDGADDPGGARGEVAEPARRRSRLHWR